MGCYCTGVSLLFNRGVQPNAAKLALDAYPGIVVRLRRDGVERCSTLRTGVMVVIREVTSTVVVPAGCRVDQPRPVDASESICDGYFGVRWCEDFAPAFVVYHLVRIINNLY